ncbi:MAG: hypothetical protein ACRELD_11160 [Longimicrobiales bacterium]
MIDRAVFVLVVLSGAACGAGPAGPLPTGRWGGEHLAMDVTTTGATLEYDCARGTVDEPIVIGADGRFTASGTHTSEHPVLGGEPYPTLEARYEGLLTGERLTLRVLLTESGDSLGTYLVTRGAQGTLFKCICSGGAGTSGHHPLVSAPAVHPKPRARHSWPRRR